MVDPGVSMLPHITMGVLVEGKSPLKVGDKVLLLLHDFRFGSQLVIEGVPLLFLKPIWDLVIAHVAYFHFPGHSSEGPID